MSDPNENYVQSAIEAGKSIATLSGTVSVKNGLPFVIVPDGFEVKTLPEMQDAPRRKTGIVRLLDIESFGKFFNEHKSDDSRVFAEFDSTGRGASTFTGVINYHSGDMPDYGDFRCVYAPRLSVEWQRWIAQNAKPMNHSQFLEFIEDNAAQITAPEGTALLEMVSAIEGVSNAKFSQALNLHSGSTRLQYDEDVQVRGTVDPATRQGQLEVPSSLTLGIAPFEFGQPYKVTARLRYRVANKQLTFAYEIIDPHIILGDAVAEQCKKITELTAVTPLRAIAPDVCR